jgi:hypothetical protein
MTNDPVTLIEEHLRAVETAAMSEDGRLPEPPDLSALVLDASDLERARALLAGLVSARERLTGMQVRVRGEIEGTRRPRREASRPAPRTVDTSA